MFLTKEESIMRSIITSVLLLLSIVQIGHAEIMFLPVYLGNVSLINSIKEIGWL
jgi:hypothetical protein